MHKETGRFLNPVIVIGNGMTALGVARTLGRHGIDVYTVSNKKDPVTFSKYCKKSFTTDGTKHHKTILKRLLTEISKSLSKRPVVYPTSDMDALTLAELKNELSDDYYFVVGDKEPVETLVNKKKFYRALSNAGIAHPQTYSPENINEAHELATKLDYPIFVRPAITQLFNWAFPESGKGFVAHTPNELENCHSLATQHGIDVMFQEIIPGPPTNSYQLEGYYNAKNNPLVLFARQRLRIWPPGFGNTTLCVSTPIMNLTEEKETINKLIAAIGYNGFASAEYKKDERDGTLKLLEINARPWWHFWLSETCGIDIAFTSYLDTIGKIETTTPDTHYELGVKSISILDDIIAAAHMLKNKKLRIHEWTTSLQGIRCDAFLSKDDPLPLIIAFLKKSSKLLKCPPKNHPQHPTPQYPSA